MYIINGLAIATCSLYFCQHPINSLRMLRRNIHHTDSLLWYLQSERASYSCPSTTMGVMTIFNSSTV